jgi:hypothetical protein
MGDRARLKRLADIDIAYQLEEFFKNIFQPQISKARLNLKFFFANIPISTWFH